MMSTPRGWILTPYRLFPVLLLAAAIAFLAWQLIPNDVQAQGVNIEEIFWCEEPEAEGELSMEECAEARDLILISCTACHPFVPIVKAQKSEEEWDGTLSVHRERVPELSEEEFQLIRQYLVTHYNPDQPVPQLPPELENLGTDQAF